MLGFKGFTIALLLVMQLALMGCANQSRTPTTGGEDEGLAVDEETNNDPFEGMNRKIFAFNDALDGYLLKPVAKGYKKVAPEPVETGVSNFFSNLGEIKGMVNNAFQWKWKKVGNNTGRLLMNTTLGLGGILDVAKHAGLDRQDGESFGQTLSYWGVKNGPYLVLPFLGPATVTDVVSMPVDWRTHPLRYSDLRYSELYGTSLLDVVSMRAGLLGAEELITGDKYVFIREAYLQRRDFLVKDGEVEDTFGDLEGFDDEDF